MGTTSIPSQGIRVPAKPQAKGLAASGMSSRPHFPKSGSALLFTVCGSVPSHPLWEPARSLPEGSRVEPERKSLCRPLTSGKPS